jgi:hypothetical protein
MRGVFHVLALMLVICVVVLVLAEGMSVGQAAYLVLITALTIGYGDITPATPAGKVVSVVVGMIGLLLTGMVVAVAVRALGQAAQEKAEDGKSPK